MSNFKKGDLVEVIGLVDYEELRGERLVLDKGENINAILCDGTENVCFAWETPFRGYQHEGYEEDFLWVGEENLRKINPDTNEKSNFTFEELMDTMKSEQLEGVE